MSTITKAQVQKRQGQAPEGWRYDWKHYAIWSENQITRTIVQPDGALIIGTVLWVENMKTNRSPSGYMYRTPSGTFSPFLSVSRWIETEPGKDVWISHGTGKEKRLSTEAFSRRNYAQLCNFARSVPDSLILDVFFGNLQRVV